jgi:hypothetical protein
MTYPSVDASSLPPPRQAVRLLGRGFNYVLFALGEADSPTPIVDWFAFNWGEWFSARQQRLSATREW